MPARFSPFPRFADAADIVQLFWLGGITVLSPPDNPFIRTTIQADGDLTNCIDLTGLRNALARGEDAQAIARLHAARLGERVAALGAVGTWWSRDVSWLWAASPTVIWGATALAHLGGSHALVGLGAASATILIRWGSWLLTRIAFCCARKSLAKGRRALPRLVRRGGPEPAR